MVHTHYWEQILPFPLLFVISTLHCNINRPFPSSKKSHFQSEAKCEAIDMKMIFNYDANKTHFHNKGFALRLVLKVRFFGTRKWPIATYLNFSLFFKNSGEHWE